MTTDNLENWGNSIIDKVKVDKLDFSDDQSNFSIFYSPLILNPKLMIIGDNPGGQITDKGLDKIPKLHEYLDPDKDKQYKLANAMRDKIMKGEKLKEILRTSVKLNRIFFKSPDLKTFKAFPKAIEMEKYRLKILEEIIDKLQPKKILAESFGTFEVLCGTPCTSVLEKEGTNKSLLLAGKYKGIEVLGINHPSSSRGLSNGDWERVSKELEKRLD
ncbi:MAG: hypothetical protein IM631_18515 [Cytophagales bacterium]|nr:hypothetical protein [Cytophagales bacterium]